MYETTKKNIPLLSKNTLENQAFLLVSKKNTVSGNEIMEDKPQAPSGISKDKIMESDTVGELTNEKDNKLESGSGTGSDSLSGDADVDRESDVAIPDYVVNYYMAVEEEPSPLWEKNLSDFSTSEMLLFLIFLLLLVQFVHKIFKGSHWFRG